MHRAATPGPAPQRTSVLPALRAAILLACLHPVGSAPDLLAPTYAWNAGLPPRDRYITTVRSSTSRNIDVTGSVFVEEHASPFLSTLGTPTVLAVRPFSSSPSSSSFSSSSSGQSYATLTVHLSPAHLGLNRLRLFVNLSVRMCAALQGPAPIIEAVLVRSRSPDVVVRQLDLQQVTEECDSSLPGGASAWAYDAAQSLCQNVSNSAQTAPITLVHRNYSPGAWTEVRADFFLLKPGTASHKQPTQLPALNVLNRLDCVSTRACRARPRCLRRTGFTNAIATHTRQPQRHWSRKWWHRR